MMANLGDPGKRKEEEEEERVLALQEVDEQLTDFNYSSKRTINILYAW